ncbi:XRE family transcriptional regulator [Eubacterium sp. AM05-23]|mgnify:CR=1 FL=1|uniref:helix-turn-helix domain-containing protein n=1 Tax=Eubacterium TaxID=1730 RepID=UPI000E467838|nr:MULTISPECIES: helix-turn-helix transcriptional regulator [Eubacterium]RHO54671.1 XRE family transcriptional regulator [Eubacterium sp. AM05-23]
MNTTDAVIQRINDLCQEHGITYHTLSYKAAIPKSTLMSIVKNKSTPTIKSIARICRGFEINVKEFFNSELFETCEEDDELL